MSYKPHITCKRSGVGWKYLTYTYVLTHMCNKMLKHVEPWFAFSTWLRSFLGLLWCLCAQQFDRFSINLIIPIWKERNTKPNNVVFVILTNCLRFVCHVVSRRSRNRRVRFKCSVAQWLLQTKVFWIFCDIYIVPVIDYGRELLLSLRCNYFQGYLTWNSIWG
jgi:hypothetical protein